MPTATAAREALARQKSCARKVRVLINALSARSGGGQTYIVNLLHLLKNETAAEILLLAPDSLEIDADVKNIYRVPVRWPVENPFLRAIWEKRHLANLVTETQADVLFCPGGIIGARIPPECRCVTMFQNMIPFDREASRSFPLGYMRLRHWILKRALLESIRESDAVIFISEYAREVIEREAGRPLKMAAVIPHGVNPVFRAAANRNLPRPGWLPREDYLLYVSNIDFYKSQVEVVQAYALLKEYCKSAPKMIFVGAETPRYGKSVRAEIRRLGLENDVVIRGEVRHAEMPAIYQHALLNIFASKCENCPNTLLEAMAAGRPVIVSQRPPMPEFAGDAAVYFDPSSPEDLAWKLIGVLSDPARLADLAFKAAKQSLRFDWQTTARETWRAIELPN